VVDSFVVILGVLSYIFETEEPYRKIPLYRRSPHPSIFVINKSALSKRVKLSLLFPSYFHLIFPLVPFPPDKEWSLDVFPPSGLFSQSLLTVPVPFVSFLFVNRPACQVRSGHLWSVPHPSIVFSSPPLNRSFSLPLCEPFLRMCKNASPAPAIMVAFLFSSPSISVASFVLYCLTVSLVFQTQRFPVFSGDIRLESSSLFDSSKKGFLITNSHQAAGFHDFLIQVIGPLFLHFFPPCVLQVLWNQE